jgi:hypothetical protein
MARTVIQQKNTNINDIKCPDVDNTPLTDGFEYPKRSKAYKMQRQAQAMGETKQHPSRTQSSAPVVVEILKRPDTMTEGSERKQAEKRVPIDPQSISILIGARGRNISLICKFARVFMSIEDDHFVTFTPRKNAHDNSLELAHRMMISMISGGVLRWFNHPAATNKYFHPSVRNELENMVTATSQCSLDLLRARNGHLCLLVLANADANLEYVEEQIRNLRPMLLEKINQYAQNPSTNDPSYGNEETPYLTRTVSDL